MDKGKLKGHAALWVANLVWGLNAPIGKSVLWSEHNPGGVSPFALSVYRMLGACLLFWSVSLFLPRERVARRDIVLLLFASVFGIQLNQMLFLWVSSFQVRSTNAGTQTSSANKARSLLTRTIREERRKSFCLQGLSRAS